MILDEYLDEFQKFLKFERNYSPNTIHAYLNDISQFIEYLDENQLVDDDSQKIPDKFAINLFFNEIAGLKLKNNSISRKRFAINSFFKFLKYRGLIDKNPMDLIPPIKEEKNLPYFLSEDETKKALTEVVVATESKPKNRFLALRDEIIMELLYNTGIRCSELLSMNQNSIDFFHRFIKVLGKGNKERIIPFSDSLVNLLQEYINQWELKKMVGKVTTDKLIVNYKGSSLSRTSLFKTVKKYLIQASTQQKLSPHILRHSFATHLLNNGADIRSVKELLGHSSLSTTQVYTHTSIEQLKKVFNQAHPRA